MIKMKIRAFFKYKDYRKQVISKWLNKNPKRTIITSIIFISIISFTVFNLTSAIYSAQISGVYMGDIFKLKQFMLKPQLPKPVMENVNKEVIENKAQANPQIKTINETKEQVKEENLLEKLQQRVKQLEQENEMLKEDNIHLQNTLKIAATQGVKPRNYKIAPPVTSRSGMLRGEYLGEFTVTAYTPTADECGNDKGITCSGHPIVPGVTVAVDRKYWPIGTVFYIKGLGYVIAMDSGGAIKGKNRFDFAVLDKNYANKIGKRKFEVYLITKGSGKVGDLKF